MSDNPQKTPAYVLPEPTQEEVNTLASQLAMIDPDRKGIEMVQLRVFYPTLGYGHIQKRLEALLKDGRVKRSQKSPNGGKVAFEYWTLTK